MPTAPAAGVPHPGLWRAADMGAAGSICHASGFALLDAELPGGGWPTRALTELLLPQPGSVEWRVLAPALARRLETAQGRVLLIGPPHAPHLRGLAAWGIRSPHCVWISPTQEHHRLWALEQALKADPGDLVAVLAWLPRVRPEALRRLQTLAAGCRALAFVLRPCHGGAPGTGSAAPLRLRVQPGPHWAQVQVEILKRRGPPLDTPLWLHAPSPALQAVLPLPQPLEARAPTAQPVRAWVG